MNILLKSSSKVPAGKKKMKTLWTKDLALTLPPGSTPMPFLSPSSPATEVHLLNYKGPQGTYKQGSSGQWYLILG